MKKSELAVKLLEMDEGIAEAITKFRANMAGTFETKSTDNILVSKESFFHNTMVDFLISSTLKSKWTKSYEADKKELDRCMDEIDVDPSGVPEKTVILGHSNVLQFSKKQNKDGTTTLLTDFVNQLNRAGVDPKVIENAMKKATKSKKGNVYYEVDVVEE